MSSGRAAGEPGCAPSLHARAAEACAQLMAEPVFLCLSALWTAHVYQDLLLFNVSY